MSGLLIASACSKNSSSNPEGSGGNPAGTGGASLSGGATAAGRNTAPGGSGAGASSSGNPSGGATSSGGNSTTAGGTPASGGASVASGGGATNGGATNGGAMTSSGGSTGTSDPCKGALICDDFEAYTDRPAGPWKLSTNNGTVAIDTTRHASGSKSVKFSTTGANSYQRAYIGIEGTPFPLSGNAFYGRMLIYVTQAANDGVHWTMIQADGPVAAQGVTNAQVRYGGQHMQRLMANYDSAGKKSDCWKHSQTKMPEGKWACMQWYFDGASNTQKFWLDGAAIDDLTVTGTGEGCLNHDLNDTWYFPQSFEKAYVGWESYQKDDAREVWIDDVALGLTQISCPSLP
ncbi:MAG TPA: hypothetical protein VFQ61_15305 [Polyangiaceae bacterium]|nr:hypothetical protein [Polyangiaceae bacterium]